MLNTKKFQIFSKFERSTSVNKNINKSFNTQNKNNANLKIYENV